MSRTLLVVLVLALFLSPAKAFAQVGIGVLGRTQTPFNRLFNPFLNVAPGYSNPSLYGGLYSSPAVLQQFQMQAQVPVNLLTPQADEGQGLITGHPAQFQNYSHYFNYNLRGPGLSATSGLQSTLLNQTR